MDKIKKILNIEFINSNIKKIKMKHLIILFLIGYISILSIYTPRHIISIVNKPFSKLIILGLILYIANYNSVIALFLALSFLVTISLDNSLQISESTLKEKFEIYSSNDTRADDDNDYVNGNLAQNDTRIDDDSDDEDDVVGYGDSRADDNEDNDNMIMNNQISQEESRKKRKREKKVENVIVEEESYESDDSTESEDDYDEDSDFDIDSEEGFDINRVKPAKNLDDGFTKLHSAIHELEGFLNESKNKKRRK